MAKFHFLADELPTKGKIVWCLREWENSFGTQREWRLAVRRSEKPMVFDLGPSQCTYWGDAENGGIGTFSDVTVLGWIDVVEPSIKDLPC